MATNGLDRVLTIIVPGTYRIEWWEGLALCDTLTSLTNVTDFVRLLGSSALTGPGRFCRAMLE